MHLPWCALFTTAAFCSPLHSTALAPDAPVGLEQQQHQHQQEDGTVKKEEIQNANHVFNAIHSSMRQWGSSVHHNGMSYFLATVPEGIQFYHGRATKEPVKGIEWLAFEPEHALVFARPRGPPGGPGGPGGHHGKKGKGEAGPPLPPHGLDGEDGLPAGYLHTYKTAHPLSLLYIDGMSAGKTEKGTLDSTDTVLIDVDVSGDVMHNENERAMQLCNRSRDEWGGRIDGFLRMEMGFEIILCDFEKHLTVERITQVKQESRFGKPGKGGPGGGGGDAGFAYYQAVAARFDGIGGDRVGLDYENFVSAFTYPADLFQDGELPRLQNVSNETITKIRDDITEMVLSHAPADVAASINWQSVADMVVARFAARLKYLALGEIESLDAFRNIIDYLLRPFIDYSARNTTLEVSRCAAQFMPHGHRPCLAADAIFTVATQICSTLSEAYEEENYAVATASIQSLTDWLQWTTWKRCSGCAWDEVCFIPIWPAGRTRDYVHPMCQKEIPQDREDNYWGGWARPPKRGDDGVPEGPYPPPPPPPAPGMWAEKDFIRVLPEKFDDELKV
ncbi:hypothetical protein K490DRAFT_41991 [Saccharata proteae CBS 121410]|uniref:Uncharacterized protein n=1 Tax=Saccharata proteae CBS 121410 TaxID=1314787 RepID=A0A9P4HWI3_9PEZI|nr:hypothetical protein K490DRAFT_41991 [Saccharata proteae CBS 121410]